MNEFPHLSEGILGEEDIPKTNTELFLSMVAQYFPEAIKDGEVDFTALKEEMGEFHEVGSEHYDFTWAGKQAAKKKAQEDIFGYSLRYKPQDSLNPDTTENIYIEGDNLDALKLLRRTYHGKIKMIYIDPPYNTGNDFVYRDNFTMTEEELSNLSGDVVDGVRFQKNTKDSARYHTDWLNMMYPRLKIARELLTDDGVIFISIDDNEIENLIKICNELYGYKNYIGTVIIKSNPRGSMSTEELANLHEYLVLYSKSIDCVNILGHKLTDEMTSEYKYQDSEGRYRLLGLRMRGGFWRRSERPNLYYPIYVNPNNGLVSTKRSNEFSCEVLPIQPSTNEDGTWRWSKEKINESSHLLLGKMVKRNSQYAWDIFQKDYYDKNGDRRTKTKSIWEEKEINYQNGSVEIKSLLGSTSFFDYSKPVFLIKRAMEMIEFKPKDYVLDFFSGSATTAHAVMQLNAEDGGNRKFIMVQLPEICDEKSEAFKAGYSNICEIGKERIRRAAKKIHEDNPNAVFDDGFKVFEVGGTTIRWNTTNDDEIKQLTDEDYSTGDKDSLDFTKGYTDIDIVYEIMLRQYGIPLSTPIEKLTEISDRTYIFADAVVVCLEPEIDDKLIEKLAAIEPTPMKFVLRDSAFGDNIELKELSFRKLSALIRSHQTEEERKSKYNNYTVEFI